MGTEATLRRTGVSGNAAKSVVTSAHSAMGKKRALPPPPDDTGSLLAFLLVTGLLVSLAWLYYAASLGEEVFKSPSSTEGGGHSVHAMIQFQDEAQLAMIESMHEIAKEHKLHPEIDPPIKSNETSKKERKLRIGASAVDGGSSKPPISITEVMDFFTNFLHELSELCRTHKTAKWNEIWKIYHDLASAKLLPWDQDYLRRMPPRRSDGSIFLSVASYRDENCLATLQGAYLNAKNPQNLFVGLVQQNCESDCTSGVLSNLKMVPVEPDQDCHQAFCDSKIGKEHCEAGRLRALHVNETESLGPYAARYFASKLWDGEEWYMQIDSHMTFAKNWDEDSIQMLKKAPAEKPIVSHYPPPTGVDFESEKHQPAPRICGGIFATSEIESQIVRLEATGRYDWKFKETPRFAPFVAAGYFVAHSEFLREVPFDPFLPWIFMGEEIIMSARLWTSGYDIFSPTHSVVGHIYVRRHKPKFWETVHRVFRPGVHNPLQMMILDRVKYQLKYPESSRDMIPKSVLTAVNKYSMGDVRHVDDYLRMVGLDPVRKVDGTPQWCTTGQPPEGFEQYNELYQ